MFQPETTLYHLPDTILPRVWRYNIFPCQYSAAPIASLIQLELIPSLERDCEPKQYWHDLVMVVDYQA